MGNKEKQTVVTLITLIITFSLYSLYVYNHYVLTNKSVLNDPSFWGKAFLILIPIMIVAQIIIHIIFSIINRIVTNEDLETINDERDKLIELKTVRISHWVFTFGYMVAMAFLAFGKDIKVMFITLLVSGIISSIASELAKIYFYKRGF